jgi:hypothetical protein
LSKAALEKHRNAPRQLLTKSNIARFATVARARLRACGVDFHLATPNPCPGFCNVHSSDGGANGIRTFDPAEIQHRRDN